MQFLGEPRTPPTRPLAGDKDDPEVAGSLAGYEQPADLEARQAAFVRMQQLAPGDKVYAVPFGSFLPRCKATRSDVKGFVPFRIPRMADVWFEK